MLWRRRFCRSGARIAAFGGEFACRPVSELAAELDAVRAVRLAGVSDGKVVVVEVTHDVERDGIAVDLLMKDGKREREVPVGGDNFEPFPGSGCPLFRVEEVTY